MQGQWGGKRLVRGEDFLLDVEAPGDAIVREVRRAAGTEQLRFCRLHGAIQVSAIQHQRRARIDRLKEF